MKYRYITFGQPTPEFMELYRAGEIPKLIAKVREEGKKRGYSYTKGNAVNIFTPSTRFSMVTLSSGWWACPVRLVP